MTAQADLGALLRTARQARGLTLVALAAAAGVSQPFLSKVERGQANPSLHSLYRIANALEVRVSDLLPGQEPTGVTVVRADAGTMVASTEGPTAPRVRLITPGAGARTSVLDYTINADQNVDDWFDSHDETTLVITDGDLTVEVRGRGTWTLGPHDVMSLQGDLQTRWATASGCSLIVFSLR
ncbi:helix-turn-helix transcriptional regulator [Isoptericola sp. NPDC019482]|uniref:helix-turn-helix domain-containing protein n=1 Tax=Isoptericola sp. NPDC019482 TaxID=3154688 RepID=UPI003490D0E9